MFDMNSIYNLLNGLSEKRIVIYPYGTNGKMINTLIDEVLNIKYQEKILVDNNLSYSDEIVDINSYLLTATDEDFIIFTAENKSVHDELMSMIKNRRYIDLLSEVGDVRRFSYQHVAAQECFDHYDVTTALLINYIKREGISRVDLLSVGAKVAKLASLMYMCNSVIHNTMVPAIDVVEMKDVITYDSYTEYVKDFFTCTKKELDNVNVVFSTVAIHCMNDTRYFNDEEEAFKSYKFAQKLTEICPNIDVVVVSVPVNKEDYICDNCSYLSDSKFIESFKNAGFTLVQSVYDKFTYNDHYEDGNRFSVQFPEKWCLQHRYVIANYVFKMKRS